MLNVQPGSPSVRPIESSTFKASPPVFGRIRFRHLLLYRLLTASVLTACIFYLASCSSDVAATPTPLATVHLDGSWTFTPQNPPNPGISSLAGSLSNIPGNGDDTSVDASGTLTLTGSCNSDQSAPFTLTGNITNPHDILLVIQLSGASGGATLTIHGQQIDNPNLITGTYTVSGGPCQTDNASFRATRDGTGGLPPSNSGS